MPPMRLGYKELGLQLVEPLRDKPCGRKKDDGAGDTFKILLEETLE